MTSTKDKGDNYELAVLNEIDRLLESGLLPFPKNLVEVRHKHKYQTPAGNEIEVDISLEITRPGASTDRRYNRRRGSISLRCPGSRIQRPHRCDVRPYLKGGVCR